ATTQTATAMAAGDFNGDSKIDLVTVGAPASGTNGSLAYLQGNGDGTFQAVKFTLGTGSLPVAVATGDFNRDGKLDAAVVNQGKNTTTDPGSVAIFLGQGNGNFVSPVSNFPVGTNPMSIAVADANGDSAPDLVLTNSSFIAVLLNSNGGNTLFQPVNQL